MLVMQTQLSDLQQHMNDVHAEIFGICMSQLGVGRASFLQPAVEAMARNAIQQMISESNIQQDLIRSMSTQCPHDERRQTRRRFDQYRRCSTIIGTVHYHTKVTTDHAGRSHVETSLKIFPAVWLASYCLTISKARVDQEWKWTLRPTPLRSFDSPIFMFSEDGNIEAVKTLLGSGQASPWDTNPLGWTPLHVSF
jgi:hypothetical protein